MKNQALKTKATGSATVTRPPLSKPFFKINGPDAAQATTVDQDVAPRPWFEKAHTQQAVQEVETTADRETGEPTPAPLKDEAPGREGALIPLTTDRETAKEAPEEIPVLAEAPLPQTEPRDAVRTEETDTASKGEAATQTAGGGPGPMPLAPGSLPAPPAAPASPETLAGTPSEIGQQFSALPPSAQADSYAVLGSDLDAAFADEASRTADAVPDRPASLEGEPEQPATPVITAPAAVPSAAGQIYAAAPEPVVAIPEAPAPVTVNQPDVPAAPPAEGGSLDAALGTIDPAPAIEIALETPEIPLEGKADPAAMGALETAAAGETTQVLGAAQAGVEGVTPEVVQPVALDQTVAAPVLPDVPAPAQDPRVEGMDQLAGYALGPLDRAAFDAQVGPGMQEAVAGAQAELDQREQDLDQERQGLHLTADEEAAAAQAEAQASQDLAVADGRQSLALEQQQTLDLQQAAVDGALGDLAASRQADAQAIDERLAADRAAVDEVYAAAEAEAQAEVEKGGAQADDAEKSAADQAESESWWDWAIDSWQALVRAVADKVIAIWETVAAVVAGILDKALALATRVVNAAVAFVKKVIAAYFDLWIRLVDKLLGSVFPELAAAFRVVVAKLQAAVFAVLDAVAAAYLQTLRFIADKLVAGLYAALEVYKAGVEAYLALWESIQNGEWADIGKTLLSALLTVVGINPEEFFTTFSKADEVVDDIVADPTLIGKRAVDALSLGFYQFGTNFIGNFTAAFVEWITGAARIVLPKTFDLAGIFDVVCQVLNLTYDYLREKAVQHIGEGAVTGIEELFAAIKAFLAEGWSGLWNFVKDKLTTLVDDVVIAMGTWLVEKAILVAGRWVAGLIATFGWSALVEGLIALWQFAMWVKDQFQQFWQIVKSTIDSVHEFVKGLIQPAADTIEGTLQDLIVPAIDLVAKLLNLGNIAKKVEQIIDSVREMVDQAIDSMVAFLKKKLGLGKEEKAEEEEDEKRDGAITLATLNEPPVTLPRTKEEEIEDLKAGHEVLKLAANKVHDTAQLAEYFEPVMRRFQLKHLGFVEIGDQHAVQGTINPEMKGYYELDSRDVDLAGTTLHDQTAIESSTRTISWTDSTGGSGSDNVAVEMVARPVGPDHRQGEGPKQSALKKIMARLDTTTTNPEDSKYIKGHLLNDNVGGPGTADNLYPITASANRKHEQLIEDWVKSEVKKGYYIYYKVNIEERSSDLNGKIHENYLHSIIKAEAGYWKTTTDPSGRQWDPGNLREATIISIAKIGGTQEKRVESMGDEKETTLEDENLKTPSRQDDDTPIQTDVRSPDSKRKADLYSSVKEGQDVVDGIQVYLDFIRRVEGLPLNIPTNIPRAKAAIETQQRIAEGHNRQALTLVEEAQQPATAANEALASQKISDAEASIGYAVDAASAALNELRFVLDESIRLLTTRVEQRYTELEQQSASVCEEFKPVYSQGIASADKLYKDLGTFEELLKGKLGEDAFDNYFYPNAGGWEQRRRTAKSKLSNANKKIDDTDLSKYQYSKDATQAALAALQGVEGITEFDRFKSAVSQFDNFSHEIDNRSSQLENYLANAKEAENTLQGLRSELDFLIAY